MWVMNSEWLKVNNWQVLHDYFDEILMPKAAHHPQNMNKAEK